MRIVLLRFQTEGIIPMKALLLKLSRFPELQPLINAFMRSGDYTPLVAMCDYIDESDAEWFRDLRAVTTEIRRAIHPGSY